MTPPIGNLNPRSKRFQKRNLKHTKIVWICSLIIKRKYVRPPSKMPPKFRISLPPVSLAFVKLKTLYNHSIVGGSSRSSTVSKSPKKHLLKPTRRTRKEPKTRRRKEEKRK